MRCKLLLIYNITDVFFVHQRGLLNSIYIWVLNVGGNLAVVAAGFITINQGWRWVWWWFTIFFGVQLIAFTFGFEETKFGHAESLKERQGSVSSARPKEEKYSPITYDGEEKHKGFNPDHFRRRCRCNRGRSHTETQHDPHRSHNSTKDLLAEAFDLDHESWAVVRVPATFLPTFHDPFYDSRRPLLFADLRYPSSVFYGHDHSR